jgi:hypothetical protein
VKLTEVSLSVWVGCAELSSTTLGDTARSSSSARKNAVAESPTMSTRGRTHLDAEAGNQSLDFGSRSDLTILARKRRTKGQDRPTFLFYPKKVPPRNLSPFHSQWRYAAMLLPVTVTRGLILHTRICAPINDRNTTPTGTDWDRLGDFG